MRSIGIRVTPKVIYFSIAEKNASNPQQIDLLTIDSLIVPKALIPPKKLNFIRTTIISILLEYGVCYAGIRITEFNSQNLDIFRLNVEGVVQEVLANSTVEKYFCGTISTIASLLGESSQDIKSYFSADLVYASLKEWDKYQKEERESIITAIAALECR